MRRRDLWQDERRVVVTVRRGREGSRPNEVEVVKVLGEEWMIPPREFWRAPSGESRPEGVRIVTPRDPASRGCQLSLEIEGDARGVQQSLAERGVVCDFREPNGVRAAPVPLYNTFHDVWTLAGALRGRD